MTRPDVVRPDHVRFIGETATFRDTPQPREARTEPRIPEWRRRMAAGEFVSKPLVTDRLPGRRAA